MGKPISNISASSCLIFMILGSLDLSNLVLARSSDKIIICVTDQVFLFSRSYKGQLKVKQKCCILCIQLYSLYLYMVMGLIENNFRLISCMSSISRHVWQKPCLLISSRSWYICEERSIPTEILHFFLQKGPPIMQSTLKNSYRYAFVFNISNICPQPKNYNYESQFNVKY